MLKEYKIGTHKINFDEEKHRFWNEHGKEIPSVTTATKIIDKSNILIAWAVKLVKNYLIEKIDKGEPITNLDIEEAAKEPKRIKETAADIGTQIHDWIDQWIQGKEPAIPDDEKVRNGITAFLRFQKENQIKFVETNRVVYSKKHGFAGFLDAIGKVKDKLVLIDFKSSNGIYPEYALQTAGYQIAYEEETKKKIDHRMIIRFGKETGAFEFKEFKDNDEDKKAFLGCLEVCKWQKKNKN